MRFSLGPDWRQTSVKGQKECPHGFQRMPKKEEEEEVSLSKGSMVDDNGATEAMKGVTHKKSKGLRNEP